MKNNKKTALKGIVLGAFVLVLTMVTGCSTTAGGNHGRSQPPAQPAPPPQPQPQPVIQTVYQTPPGVQAELNALRSENASLKANPPAPDNIPAGAVTELQVLDPDKHPQLKAYIDKQVADAAAAKAKASFDIAGVTEVLKLAGVNFDIPGYEAKVTNPSLDDEFVVRYYQVNKDGSQNLRAMDFFQVVVQDGLAKYRQTRATAYHERIVDNGKGNVYLQPFYQDRAFLIPFAPAHVPAP